MSSSDDEGSSEHWEEPEDPHPPLPKERRLGSLDPDFVPQDEGPRQSARRLFAVEAMTDEALEQQVEEVPAQVSTHKHKRDQLSMNKAEGIYKVTTLDPKDGEPIEPAGVKAKWRNRCGKVEWDEFVEQKTSSASKELSEKTVELNKQNKYKPRRDFVKDPTTVEVVQALKVPITTQTEAGPFTSEYHKDELAKAIGTKEHGGRVRGVSSSATWKEGFSDTSSHLYKKHTLNKKEREDKAKEDWRRQLLMFAIDKESGRLDPNLLATMDAFLRGSSTSTQPSVSTQPFVSGQRLVPMQSETENITEDTPCELHVPFGYKGMTMKVASDTAFPGEMLHNRDIPPGYVRVTMSEIVPDNEDNEIECPDT
ncbi:hypothetical protein PR202_ga27672 [Eleusine coracana subsp. coracana]|uniref:DUF8039 domain-containing protein n=1 Tax=Eleusine coracana subsp. coracana TaxID=191504 RepID=A0AAV5DGJ9_ELECO|nr:hypothetical protein PR202_ga27672 [Eleusine coracana subsp. coracana]